MAEKKMPVVLKIKILCKLAIVWTFKLAKSCTLPATHLPLPSQGLWHVCTKTNVLLSMQQIPLCLHAVSQSNLEQSVLVAHQKAENVFAHLLEYIAGEHF